MTIDEALREPGDKVSVWTVSAGGDGRVGLSLYVREPGALKYLASSKLAKAEVAARRAEIEGSGLVSGARTLGADIIWLEGPGSVAVYRELTLVLEANGDRLTAGERSWPRAELGRFIAYAADDFIEHGIKVALASGEEVPLLVGRTSAYSVPDYGPDELAFDTAWCVHVANALSRWAGLGEVEERGL